MIEAVEIPLRDGVVLRGELIRGGGDWTVLVHDPGEDLDAWSGLPSVLAAEGMSVLAFDLRGHGGSDGAADPARDEDDLEDVVEFVRGFGAERIFLGAAGGSVRAALAVGEREGAGLFALAPKGPPQELPPAPSLAKLVIVGADDPLEDDAASVFAGFALVVRLPVSEDLLHSSWGASVRDYVVRFLRDARLRPPLKAHP